MRYLRVRWLHANPDFPIELYSELDDDSWEVRKVEVFADGRADYADPFGTSGDTGLGETPVPPIGEIARDPQFRPEEIGRDEFEAVWEAVHHVGNPR